MEEEDRRVGRGDGKGRRRWKKVLYGGRQVGYEDNYTDSSFLEEMVMNANVRRRRTWIVMRDSVAVSQHVCVVGLVGTVWMHSLDGALDAWVLLQLDGLILILGFATLFLTTHNLFSISFLQHHILNFSLFVTALYILAPIFQTLTRAISSDSIWTSTVCLLLVHLVFHDYTYTTMHPETMADDDVLGSPGTPLWATKQDVFQPAAMGLGFPPYDVLGSPGTPLWTTKQDVLQPAAMGLGFSSNGMVGSPGSPSWTSKRDILQPAAVGLGSSANDELGSPGTPSWASEQENLQPAAMGPGFSAIGEANVELGSPETPQTSPQVIPHAVSQFAEQKKAKLSADDVLGSPGTRTTSNRSSPEVLQPAGTMKAMGITLAEINVMGSPRSPQTPWQATHEVSPFASWQKAKFSTYDALGSPGTPQTPSRAQEILQAGAKSKKAMGITFSANVSLNAAIVASVLIASRLPSRLLVFALMLFSLEFFLLFPLVTHCMRRRSVNFHLGFCCTLIGVTMGLIFPVSRLAFSLFAIVILFITLVCPYWLIRIQEYKFEINGPWDEAKLCFDVGD